MTDRKIIRDVITEWNCGAGTGVVVPAALGMLLRLERSYGDKVTVDGACDALENLSETAIRLRNNLRKEQQKQS